MSKEQVRLSILGSEQTLMSLGCASREIIDTALGADGGYYFVSNTHQVVLASESKCFREAQLGARASIPDSAVLQAVARAIDLDPVPKFAPFRGFDLLLRLLKDSEGSGLSIGFLGGREATLEKILARCQADHPALSIDFCFSPAFLPLREWDFDSIASSIRRSKVDLLIVGLGCPKQELFMAQIATCLPSLVMVGVGAAFEFYTGDVRPSPKWVHQAKLEWLYRLCAEPRRLFSRYLYYNTKFSYLSALEFIARRF